MSMRIASYGGPKEKKALLEYLHRRDNQDLDFCELARFGDFVKDGQVRDRAIQDRIEAVKQSHSMKYKFEDEFNQAKKAKQLKVLKNYKAVGNFIKKNTQFSSNFTVGMKE